MLRQRVTIGTVEEIQKTTKTINLEKAGGRGRIKCPGNAPTLLYQSNNSSNDLCYLLSHSFSTQDVFLRPTEYQRAFPNTKSSQRFGIFSFFFKYLSHDTCSHSYGTLFPFSGIVIYFENKCWLVFHIATEFINSYHLHFNSSWMWR